MESQDSYINSQIQNFPTGSEEFISPHNIFKILTSICIACVCTIYNYLVRRSLPTLTNPCDCKPCHCQKCTSFAKSYDSNSIELRILYENKSHDELDHVECKNNICKVSPRNYSNYRAKCIANLPIHNTESLKLNEKNPETVTPPGDKTPQNSCHCSPCLCADCIQRCLSLPLNQIPDIKTGTTRLNSPHEICLNNYNVKHVNAYEKKKGILAKEYHNFRTTIVENHPLIIPGNNVDICDPLCDEMFYLCHCQCNDGNKSEFDDFFKTHKVKSAVCKCSPCECLSCPLQEKASSARSQESLKASARRQYTDDEWKSKPSVDGHETQKFKNSFNISGGPAKNTKIKVDDVKCSEHCVKYRKGSDSQGRSCQCSSSFKQYKRFKKKPVDEILHNVYGPEIEIEENNRKILSKHQLLNNNALCTVANIETNTEHITVNKSIETEIAWQPPVQNKVKNYEYTLKIEIITPKVDSVSKHSTKQKIKRVSKNKIREQTQKVMNDIINDISRNSTTESPQIFDKKDLKALGCIEQCRKPSILKQVYSPMSFRTIETSPGTPGKQSPSIASSTRSKDTKMEEFIIGCITPLQEAIVHLKGASARIVVSKSELPSKDGSLLFKNTFCPLSPDQISKSSNIELGLGKYLDELRVHDVVARRVSHHTVSLKWNLPKAVEEIIGYEILVDGKSIETILNRNRCMAVISCLPPVRRLLITIRSITKNPMSRLLPCTTIGYKPRANKYIRI